MGVTRPIVKSYLKEIPEPNSAKRQAPRRPIYRMVGLMTKGQYTINWAYEIGEGGILVDSQIPLVVGDRVLVTVRIPGVLQGVMISKVIYQLDPKSPAEKVRYGLKFDYIDFDIKRKMRNYVASSTRSVET